jgi:hypothetical protein
MRPSAPITTATVACGHDEFVVIDPGVAAADAASVSRSPAGRRGGGDDEVGPPAASDDPGQAAAGGRPPRRRPNPSGRPSRA